MAEHSVSTDGETDAGGVFGAAMRRGTGIFGQSADVRGRGPGPAGTRGAEPGGVRRSGSVLKAYGRVDRAGSAHAGRGFRGTGGGGVRQHGGATEGCPALVPAAGAGGVVPAVGTAGDGGDRAVYVRVPVDSGAVADGGVCADIVRPPAAAHERRPDRNPVGGTSRASTAVVRLLAVAELRNVEIQVMPLARDHAGLAGPMQLLETPENRWLAYCEGQESGQFIGFESGQRAPDAGMPGCAHRLCHSRTR